jgi:Family of unknown function (DUF6459)
MLPTTPPLIRACFTDRELRERERARPRLRPAMPSPVAVVGWIAVALCEVEAGARPRHQLERACHPTLWEVLVRQLGASGPAVTSRSLRRVLAQESTPGIVDGVAVVQRGGLVEPVAMRLDAAVGRWEVTELQYVPAGGDPDTPGQQLAGRIWGSAVLPRAVQPLPCRLVRQQATTVPPRPLRPSRSALASRPPAPGPRSAIATSATGGRPAARPATVR